MDTTNSLTEQDLQDLALMLLYTSAWRVTAQKAKNGKPATYYPFVKTWKNIEFDLIDKLHEEGLIDKGKNTTKSLSINSEGQARAKALIKKYFGKDFEVIEVGE